MSETPIKSSTAFPHFWRGLLRFAISLVVVAGLFAGTIYFTIGRALRRSTEPVADFSRYPEILARETQGGVSRLLTHLPNTTVIERASDTRLFYQPRFLQGGGCLYLKLKLPHELFASECLRLRPLKIATLPEDTPQTYDYFKGENPGPLSNNYELWSFILQPKTENQFRNHGEEAGIAIAPAVNEIVYWAEWW